MRRSLRSLFQAVVLLVGVLLVAVGSGYSHYGYEFSEITPIGFGQAQGTPSAEETKSQLHESSPPESTPPEQTIAELKPSDLPATLPDLAKGDRNDTLLVQTAPYLKAIMDSYDTTFPRLEYPTSNLERYASLQQPTCSNASDSPLSIKAPRYFFALDLHQCADLLPRLIGSIVETTRFLGPENCVLSTVEGRSDDGTFEVLKQLQPEIENLGSRYMFQSSDINPKGEGTDRIKALAELRNLALKDLLDHPQSYADDATVIFSNDIALCMEDILELVHQRVLQGGDMTCVVDWTYVGDNPTFYDVWIAHGMTGESFFNIPENSSWAIFLGPLLERRQSPIALEQLAALPSLLLLERDHGEDECYQGEPKLFAKDMWYHGHGRIAIVPSVNVEYSNEASTKIKALKGYVSRHVASESKHVKIEWESKPPTTVKCIIPGGNAASLTYYNPYLRHRYNHVVRLEVVGGALQYELYRRIEIT
ncbi:glycosyltransferase family 69 protein [Pleomassaria siparia CBS 279.74]|uniref:Glycosyltransferase family 69 protein n=1 Tax=Pleomassaria siparia CBS 279.74 TaxID=1314801 RepID=A0A6G1KB34_9PLEO|nr:glycosyltransferase family 69 protein [Pleomassaria siparia CBS 279.74]